MKWKIEDPDSHSQASFVEVTFDLTVISICTTNKISKSGTGLDSQTYYLGSEELKITPLFTIATSIPDERCPLKYSFFVNNVLQDSNTAPFTSFDDLTG